MEKKSKINFGYIDEIYSYKLWTEDSFEKNVNLFKKLKCVITNSDYENKSMKLKEAFSKYLDGVYKESEKEISIGLDSNTKETHIRIKVANQFVSFIEDNMNTLCETLNSNSYYLGKPTSLFMTSFLLQPIYLFYNKKEYLINVKASIYSTGNLILQYSIPIENIEFKYYSNSKNNKLEQSTYLPIYIKTNTNTYEYEKEKTNLNQAIQLYNKYVIDQIKKEDRKVDTKNTSFFQNYTLIDYDGKPETFDGMSADISRNIYWILNGPYGYFNEREKNIYNKFHQSRYSISAYCALFTTTTHRSVVIFNRQTPSNETIKQVFSNPEYKYKMSNIYLSSSLDMMLIKKNYYNLISDNKFDKYTNINEILKKITNIIDVNDFIFHVNYEGYGSVTRLEKYLEESLTDFLPSKTIEDTLNLYKEIVQLKEAQSKEKYNTIISVIAMIFPIIFGLDAIENMLTILDSKFNTHLNWFLFEIWIIVIIGSVFLIGKNSLYIFYIKILRVIKKTINLIKRFLETNLKNI